MTVRANKVIEGTLSYQFIIDGKTVALAPLSQVLYVKFCVLT